MRKQKRRLKVLASRKLRIKTTSAEDVLWNYLRNRNYFAKKFRRQYVLKGFILDFYCFEDKLGIELDGSVHLKQKEYDHQRDRAITTSGVRMLRFKNEDVLDKTSEVLSEIARNLSLSSSAGEGRTTESGRSP